MDEKKEFLNEERYQENKKKILKVALIILIIGFLIGVSLIATGLIKQGKINEKYSDASKATQLEKLESEKNKISGEIEIEKQNVITSKSKLEEKIKPVEDEIKSLEREKFTGFDDDYYARKDKIEELEKSIAEDRKSISTINKVLDIDNCDIGFAKNNIYTSKYCSLKNQLNQKNLEISNLDWEYSDFNKSFDSDDSIPFYMFGAFVIFASCAIAGSIYMFAKRREILSFKAQQFMPVAQEGIEKMAPTVGKARATIAKEMAPVYGEIAKEISKGIKEGMKGTDKK